MLLPQLTHWPLLPSWLVPPSRHMSSHGNVMFYSCYTVYFEHWVDGLIVIYWIWINATDVDVNQDDKWMFIIYVFWYFLCAEWHLSAQDAVDGHARHTWLAGAVLLSRVKWYDTKLNVDSLLQSSQSGFHENINLQDIMIFQCFKSTVCLKQLHQLNGFIFFLWYWYWHCNCDNKINCGSFPIWFNIKFVKQ